MFPLQSCASEKKNNCFMCRQSLKFFRVLVSTKRKHQREHLQKHLLTEKWSLVFNGGKFKSGFPHWLHFEKVTRSAVRHVRFASYNNVFLIKGTSCFFFVETCSALYRLSLVQYSRNFKIPCSSIVVFSLVGGALSSLFL